MKPPEFQYLLPIQEERHWPERYEVWIDGVGYTTCPRKGVYELVRELIYSGQWTLNCVARAEDYFLGRNARKETAYVDHLGRICLDHDPVRATAAERLRALARVIGGEA